MFPDRLLLIYEVVPKDLFDEADALDGAVLDFVSVNSRACDFACFVPLELLGHTSCVVCIDEAKDVGASCLAVLDCCNEY